MQTALEFDSIQVFLTKIMSNALKSGRLLSKALSPTPSVSIYHDHIMSAPTAEILQVNDSVLTLMTQYKKMIEESGDENCLLLPGTDSDSSRTEHGESLINPLITAQLSALVCYLMRTVTF